MERIKRIIINSKFGLSYSWTAKNTICNISSTDKEQVNRYDICWESIDGVPNRGHASFYLDYDKLSKMTLTIQYSLPDPLAFIIQSFGKNNLHSVTLYFIFILYFLKLAKRDHKFLQVHLLKILSETLYSKI